MRMSMMSHRGQRAVRSMTFVAALVVAGVAPAAAGPPDAAAAPGAAGAAGAADAAAAGALDAAAAGAPTPAAAGTLEAAAAGGPNAAAAGAPNAAAGGPTPAAPGFSTPPDGEALARAYRAGGAAPTVERGDAGGRGVVTLVPFGHARPVVRCAPLRACAVELEPGELVLATSLGDGERWLVQAAAAGAGARTPLLVVKPVACDLASNLLVATDRRLYEIALESPPCGKADSGESGATNPRLPYTAVVRFYYPDDLVRRWTEQERLAREQAAELAAGRTPLAAGARLAHLNFDYAWDRGRKWPWVPVQVFDDGAHSYVVLPPAARRAELPILLAVEPGGALALLTYHLDGETLIADRVLERAVLVVGHGRPRDEQRLEIVNRAAGRRAGG
jgi:P-type conjugative transfer protein TrbG